MNKRSIAAPDFKNCASEISW